MKKSFKYIIALIIVTIGIIIYPHDSFADDYNAGLVVSPTSQKITLKPGEKYRSSFFASNPYGSSSDLNFVAYVTPYAVSNELYDPIFDRESTYTQIANWITLDQNEGTIKPNETIEIGFTIIVPNDAPAGGQYATIMVQNNASESLDSGNSVAINDLTAVGSIIVAEVAGETREKGLISENSIPSFLLNNKLEATSMVQNDGNVHANATYVLQVWPLFSDEEICTNEENPTISLIMPETKKFNTENCDLPSVGIFRAKQTVKLYGETSITEKTIIVCPLWLLFIIVFTITSIIIYIVMKSKELKKK